MTRIDYLAVHCSATPADGDFDASDIRRWHRERGFRDIGYHYVITRSGEVQKGRPDDMAGAHERKINRRSISICLVGGSPPTGSREYRRGLGEDNFTPAQKTALAQLLLHLKEQHPDAEVIGHRDVQGVRKACPSFDVKPWWEGVLTYTGERERLSQLGGHNP